MSIKNYQTEEWEKIKKAYLASLTVSSQIVKTKSVFSHLDDFLSENSLTFKDLSANLDRFEAYLQNKLSKKSFYVYWSYFQKFYGWLEKECLKIEPVSAEVKPQPEPQRPAIKEPARVSAFDLNEWIKDRDRACARSNCQSEPFQEKGRWYVVCPRPRAWKETKYGGYMPAGKGARGKIPLEVCQSTQASLLKRLVKPKRVAETAEETEFRIAQLRGKIQHLTQRMKQLEPYESALFIAKQRRQRENYVRRLLIPEKSFKCWVDLSATISKCRSCPRAEGCRDRLVHEPTIRALTYMEKELRNRKYCPLKDVIMLESHCLFKCSENKEECQRLKEDSVFLTQHMDNLIELFIDAIQPLETPLKKWAEAEAQAIAPPEVKEVAPNVDQLGICLDPIHTRETHSLACIVCKSRHYIKWQACQETQKEIEDSPALKAIVKQRSLEKKEIEDWWQAPKTEDMTLEEIEEELGLREQLGSFLSSFNHALS